MRRNTRTNLVYTTEYGRMCPACGQVATACTCRRQHSPTSKDGVVRVSRETKGRKGAGVTIISGLCLDQQELSLLAGELKRRCGSGGTAKDGRIEIQGDHRQLLMEELAGRGWKPKLSGG